jgi:hypothetical protein
MAATDTERSTLDNLNTALRKWTDMQFNDTTNTAIGLRAQIMEQDLPQLRRVRWYAMHDQVHATELWQRYVENLELEGELKETVFDFYVTGASYIWLVNPTASENYDAFIAHLCTNLSWMKRCTLVPPDLKEHAAEHAQIESFLKGNHWAVFLILLSMLDLQ